MRAIKIDTENCTINEIDITGDLKSLQKEVGGYITQAFKIPNSNSVCFVDEKAFLETQKGAFESNLYRSFLYGNGIIIGIDSAGNNEDSNVNLSDITNTTFIYRSNTGIVMKRCKICKFHYRTHCSDYEYCEICYKENEKQINKSKEDKKKAKEKKYLEELREEAKSFKAKNLKGSQKQVKWAEQLRRLYLLNCKRKEMIREYINCDWLLESKFWIEQINNRELESDLLKMIDLTDKIKNGEENLMEQRAIILKKLNLSD